MKIGKNIQIALGVVAIVWLVYLLDLVLPTDLRQYGLQPRRIQGLWGIAFSPFLHANRPHILANTGALFVLLLVSLSVSRKLTVLAIFIVTLGGGGLVWLFGGGNTVHIGASGVIFGLIGFLIFMGLFRREWVALVVSIAILFFYGGTLFTLLTYVPGVSWEGHFFGFFTGLLAAWWTKGERTQESKP